MTTFPHYQLKPATAGRQELFPQAVSAEDVAVRYQVAAWALQKQQGFETEVSTYYTEVIARDIVTEPVTGPEIRAYQVARNLIEYAQRGITWDSAVTYWLEQLYVPNIATQENSCG